MADNQQQKPVMSGGFYEKFCVNNDGTGIFTPPSEFGQMELLKIDSMEEVINDLKKFGERLKEKRAKQN